MSFTPIPIDGLLDIGDTQESSAKTVIQQNGVTFKATTTPNSTQKINVETQAQLEAEPVLGTNLEIADGVNLTINLLDSFTLTKPIKGGLGSGLKIISSVADISITYTGPGKMVQNTNPANLMKFTELENFEAIGDFPNDFDTSVIDVKCSSHVTLKDLKVRDWGLYGIVEAPTVRITNPSAFNILAGLTIRNPLSLFIDVGELDNDNSSFLTTFFSIITNVVTFATINNLVDRTLLIGCASVFIDPYSTADSRYIVNGSSTLAGRTFQKIGGGIPKVVSSVADNGNGKARFTTVESHGLIPGMVVTLSGFLTETTYNVSGLVTAVDVFLGGTVFEIDEITFAGDDTGIMSTISLDSTSVLVKGTDNTGIADSKNIAVVNVVGNATSFVPGTSFGSFDFGASAVAGSTIEGWELLDAQTGRVRYIGVDPIKGTLNMVCNVNTTSKDAYTIALVKDPTGSPTVLVESGDVTADDPIQLSLGGDVGGEIINGDEFEPQIKVDAGAASITVPQMTFTIE